MKRLALATCALWVASSDIWANGAIFDGENRASANVLVSSKRFRLDREELDVKLNAKDYQIRVTYFLADSAAGGRQAAAMYFPVVCAEAAEEDGAARHGGCIREFEVRLNDRVLAAAPVSAPALAKSAALKTLAKQIDRRTQKAFAPMREFPARFVFYKINIPADIEAKSLAISYQAKYERISAESSKSAHGSASDDVMIYDFYPAAAWMGTADKDLHLKIDVAGALSTVTYDKKTWPFSVNGDRWELAMHNPDFAHLPPLVLGMNNANYYNYASDMRALEAAGVRYRVGVVRATPSATEHRHIEALTDRNSDTSWCWKGKRAELEMELDAYTIRAHTDKPGGQPTYYSCRVEGIALVNGAVSSKAAFDEFGLVHQVKVADAKAASGGERRAITLHLPRMAGDKDKYQSFAELSVYDWAQDAGAGTIEIPEPPTKRDRANIPRRKVRIKILDVFPRKSSDESCISEIYPYYNCG